MSHRMTVSDWINQCSYDSRGRCFLNALVSRVAHMSHLRPTVIEAEIRAHFEIKNLPIGEIVEGVCLR